MAIRHNHEGHDHWHTHSDAWEEHGGGPHGRTYESRDSDGTTYDYECELLDFIGPAFGRKEMKPWKWIESTRELQKLYKDGDPADLPRDSDELANFIMWNTLAAHTELSEFLCEVYWKPWSAARRGEVNRMAAIKELVDVAHFIANILASLQCTDAEWETAYRHKQQVNRDRVTSGTYTGHKKLGENDA